MKILFVEDDYVDRMAFERFAGQDSTAIEYEVAESVGKAMGMLENNTYDAVLSDYDLGGATAMEILNLKLDVPIVIVTGTGNEEIAVSAMKSGAYDYIIKDPDGFYLKTIPITLEKAVDHRKKEQLLIEYREHLEELVSERTKELVQSRERFKDLSDLLPLSVFETDISGSVTFGNVAVFKSFGYSHKTIENGLTVFDLIHPDERSRARLTFDDLREGRSQTDFEYTGLNENGATFPMLLYVSAINRDGQFAGIRGVALDISEIKAIETELKLSRKELLQAQEIAQIGNWDYKKNEELFYFSEEIGRIFEMEPGLKKISYQEMMQAVLPEYRYKVHEAMNACLEEKKPFDIEYATSVSGDKRKYVHVLGLPVEDDSGMVTNMIGTVHDVTEKNRATREIEALSNESKMIFDSVPSCIWYKDTDNKFIRVNNAAADFMGLRVQDIQGKTAEDIFPLYAEKYLKDDLEVIHTGEPKCGILEEASKANGEIRWVRTDKIPFKDKNGHVTGILAVSTDITEQKRAEEELLEAKDKAERSDRLKSEFLAQMSHEIRTPINAVLSFSQLIRDEIEDRLSQDLKTSFNIISRAGKRIIRTIDLLLNMSEVQSGAYEYNPKEMDLNSDILENVYADYLQIAKDKGLKFDFVKTAGATRIVADEYSMNQIFYNLVDNAVKYTPEGNVTIRSIKQDDRIIVEIEDTGIGISNEYTEELFTPFSQEEMGYTRRFEGNGLGLALVKNYCEINSVDIKCESTKGKGTIFTVIINL